MRPAHSFTPATRSLTQEEKLALHARAREIAVAELGERPAALVLHDQGPFPARVFEKTTAALENVFAIGRWDRRFKEILREIEQGRAA